jgi:hypothetical protein
MSPSAFSLTGIERVDSAEFAQSWLVTPGIPPTLRTLR